MIIFYDNVIIKILLQNTRKVLLYLKLVKILWRYPYYY